jgi:hypothetical protein
MRPEFMWCVLLTTHILLVHGYRETFVIKSECEINAQKNDWVETPCVWDLTLPSQLVTLYAIGGVLVPPGLYTVVTRRGAYATSTDIQTWAQFLSYARDITTPSRLWHDGVGFEPFHPLQSGDEVTVCTSGEVCVPCYGAFQQWDANTDVCTCTAEFQQWDPIIKSCRCIGGYSV